MPYNPAEDEDKKKSGGSSSYKETSKSSKQSAPPSVISAKDTTYISVNRGNGGVTQTTKEDFDASRNAYRAARKSGQSATQAWHTSAGPAMNQRGTYYPNGYKPPVRGSSQWNQQQNSLLPNGQQRTNYAPENATQGLSASKATQYGLAGVNGISAEGDIYGNGKWWIGNEPNDIDYAARIIATQGGDPELFNQLYDERNTPGNSAYRAYGNATSPAVQALRDLGADIPESGITDEWLQQNEYLLEYLKVGKTGTVSQPGKRGTPAEWAAYWYYTAVNDKADTDNAEKEVSALKEEIGYLTGSNKNLSDEEIAARIDWTKYPTLQKMDKNAGNAKPVNLIRRIDWSQDYLGGMIWAARNDGGSGNFFEDAVYARLGYGNGYAPNDETVAKRTWGDPKYSPYSLGPSSKKMEEAGMYFGRYSFDQDWIDQNGQRYMNSMNPKDAEMFQRVLEANIFTRDCEAELDELLNGTVDEDGTRVGGLDSAVADFSYSDDKSFEENLDALMEEVYGGRNYRNLEKLDDSMANGALRDTTRAIDYRKQDIREQLAEKLQAKQTAPTVKDAGDETETWFERAWRGLQSAFTPEPTPDPSDLVQIKGEAGNAVEDTRQKTAASVGKTVNDIGTPSEKNQWRTGEIGQQETSDKIGGNIKKGIPTGTGGQVMLDLIDGSVDGTDYINNRNTILQYEDNNERLKGIHEERDQILNRRKERKGGYINRNDEIAANFGQNSTKSASLFGWVFGNNEPVEDDEEEVEAVEQEYRPAVADMTLDQKTAWIQRKINNVNTTDEEAAGLRDLLAQYRASANWDDNDEAVPMQRQMLDDALAQYIGEPAYAPQNTGIDPEIARLQQEAMDAVSKLNPDVETFEEAQAWVAEQEGDSEDLADAKDAVRLVELAGEERVLNVRQEEMQADYDKAFDMIKGLRNRYAEDQTVWTVTGSGGETNLIAADVLDFVSQFGDYVPYQYSDTNYYDYLTKDKGYSAEQAREEAIKNNESYRELKNYIQTALNACDEKGVSIPADYRQHMEQAMLRLDKQIADGTYYALRGNEDFDSTVADALKPKEYKAGIIASDYRPAGLTDMEYAITTALNGSNVALNDVRSMTEDEQKTFLYVLQKQGGRAAQRYYDHLTDEYGAVTTRQGREMTEQMYNDFRALDAVTFNIGGTAATVAMHPLQMMGGLYTFGMAMTGKIANPDSAWFAIGKASSRERETIKGLASDAIGSMWGETAGRLAGDGYDLVTGVFDNLMDAAVMNGLGFAGPLGEAGEAASFGKKAVYNIVNGTVTAMPLGMSAAGMEYVDAIGRGLDPTQAYLLAGISGLAEAVTEGLEIESFTEAYGVAGKEGFKGLLKNIALSMTNEAVGEALGQYAENVADDKIAGHMSNRNQLFEQYVAAGYGKEEAHKMADHAMTMDIVKSAIMGGLSGGLSTALTGSAGALHYESDYSSFKRTNADYLTNVMNGLRDLGYSESAAKNLTENFARDSFDEHNEEITKTANNMKELRAERSSVDLTAIEAENAANENAQRLQEADMAADEFAEEQGEPFTPYTPAERPVNPRMEEVNIFEITPLTQFNELTDELAKIDGTETFSGEVKSEAVETLYSAVGYTDMAQEAAANGDTQTADDYLRKGMAAFNALDAILDRAGIDKGRFPFLTDTEAMAQVREYMNRQGPEQQFKQTGGEQTTLIPGESETAPIVDNEGLTAEDARAEKVDTRPVEMQGGQVTNLTGESETSPDVNPVEAMETVNRGPEPLRPIQGPTIRKNPFSAEFKRELQSRDQMKGQVLTLSGKQATPANGATMLAGVFDSVVAMKDSITDGQAMAAAKRLLGKAKDVDSVIGAVRSILVTAADQSINNTDTVTAIQTAALTDGEAGRILDNIINIGTATPNRVRNLVATAMREAGTLANEMWANTYDGMVAEIVHRMAGEGALTRTSKAQADERARYSQLKEAQKTTETQEEVIAALQQKLTNAYDTFKATPLDKIAEAAFNSAQKQLDAAFSVLMSYRKSETNARNAHSQAQQNYFDTRNEEMTQVREAARQEADQRIAEARAQRQEREAQRQARGNAIVGKKGRSYLNNTTPIDFHYELVDDNALIASNDVNGNVNPEYPAYLQPRDRTRAVSQSETQRRAADLNPEMLGANPDIAQGAPVVGPDYAIESGNGRTMSIRLARQGNLPGAVRYTEMLRNRAAEFGFNPEQVGPNSVLVRVRDTPVNRADFTRSANVQATSRMSAPEQAKVDADRITPEMLAKYNMETDTAADAFKGKQNQDFLDAFLKTIPEAEMGNTRDSKGMISEDGKERVRNALIQFAYDSERLTRALTENKGETSLNLKNVLSNLAPLISNYRSDISEGRFQDIGLLDKLTEAVENYVDLKARGENVYDYVNNYVMEGFEEISNAAKEMMLMFEQNVRSGKKIGRYLSDLIRNVTKEQDSDQTSMLDFGEIPTDLASTIRGSFDQTAQAIENEANGIAKGQVGFLKDIRALRETTRQSDVSFPSLGISRTLAFTGTDAEIADAEAREAERAAEFDRLINSDDFMALEMRKPDGRTEILSRSSRPGVAFQLTYMGSDGEANMHESYGEAGENTTGENIHSMEELYRHFVRANLDSDISFNVMRNDRALRTNTQDIQRRDAEYQQAVDNGDMETAQRLVDEAAKKAGYTLRGYHGTKSPTLRYDTDGYGEETDYRNKRLPFTVFKAGQSGGIYMATNRKVSEGFASNFRGTPGTVMSVYTRFQNPLIVNEHVWTSVPFYYNIPTPSIMKEAGYTQETVGTEEISLFAQERGYDGLIIEGIREGGGTQTDDYIAFNPNQIKLADPVTYDDAGNVIPLSARFNQSNPDIRYARVGSQAQAQANRQARQGKPTRSPQQISKDLMAKLGVGDYVPTNKDIPKGVLGYFRTRPSYIAVTPNEAGNFTTTMHEIGHAIAQKLGITGTQQMVNNLPAAFHNAYSKAELPGEAFAEFMWRYIENDQSARQFASDAFVDDFERRMDDAGIADDVHDAANAIRQFLNADASEKIGAVIRDASDKRRKPIREWFRSIIARNVDASSAAEKLNSKIRKETGNNQVDFSMDVRQNARMENSAEKRAGFILTQGMMDANWSRTGEDGLAQVFEKNNIVTKEDVDLLSRYMLAKHSFDRDAQGKPVFSPTITVAERRAFINDIESKHKNIVAAAKGFQEFRHNVMKHLMVDTGFLGPNGDALLAKWEEMYPNYVPTYRFKDGESNTMGKSGYQVKEAKGSTEDIINPIESFADIVKKIVVQVSQNNTALAMHNAYQTIGNLGEFMREVTPDKKKVSVDTRNLQKTVERLVKGQVSAQTLQDVLKAIGEKQERWIEENGTRVQNAITVQLPDGTQRYYQVNDQELYNLLSAVPPAQIQGLAQTIGRATRGMTAVTTGSNPLFAFRNAMRDFQNSVNYGSWAATYLDGAVKWMKAFYDVWTGSNNFKDYQALGGGGWMRINPTQKKSARELRNELLPGYENGTAKGLASKALNKVSSLVTLERLNEVIEQTSRYVEYSQGKHDLSTAEGRQEAYLAGQDVTVDFGRRGYGSTMNVIKQVIPFFSAATQGVYRTGRMLTEAERGRALARFGKTIFNTALTSALAAGILLKFGDDDDKFAFENMSDDLKSNHFFFPNIAPHIFGERPLIRIPLSQDPLTYAVHGFMTNAAWYGTTDQDVIDIMAIANTILDNLNPASGGPIWSAISDVQKNKTWYGSKIIPTRLEELNTNPSAQYTEDTPDMFVAAGRALNVSPLNLQYLAEQYTGFVGQLLIPALSKDKHTGQLGGWQAAIAAAQNRFTTDPLVSNEAVGAFYDGADMLSDIVSTVKDGQPLNQLRRGISQGEAKKAYTEAEKLVGKDGLVANTKKKVTAWYADIDKINANTSLSNDAKYEATSAIRMKMVRECLRTNEQIEKYREKYITGIDFATASLWQALFGQNPTVKQNKKKK